MSSICTLASIAASSAHVAFDWKSQEPNSKTQAQMRTITNKESLTGSSRSSSVSWNCPKLKICLSCRYSFRQTNAKEWSSWKHVLWKTQRRNCEIRSANENKKHSWKKNSPWNYSDHTNTAPSSQRLPASTMIASVHLLPPILPDNCALTMPCFGQCSWRRNRPPQSSFNIATKYSCSVRCFSIWSFSFALTTLFIFL